MTSVLIEIGGSPEKPFNAKVRGVFFLSSKCAVRMEGLVLTLF